MREETTKSKSQSLQGAGSPYELLRLQAEHFAANDLLVLPRAVQELWREERRRWTYADCLAEVDAPALAYREAGYGPGHRVALLLENRPAHYLHWLALNAAGASVVPLNPDYTADELAYVLEHSDAALLVALEARRGMADEIAHALDIPVASPAAGTYPAPRRSPAVASADMLLAQRECALVYTSGTTGRPKGCLLSNAYFLGWSEWYGAQGGAISLREGCERLITPLPTFHVNAMGNSFMGMLGAGGAQIIVDRFHPRSWWEMTRETAATCFHYLGVMPAILLALPPAAGDPDHGLRFGLGGGVHPDQHRTFEERFGVPLLEGWAMTESGGACLLCAAEEPRHVGMRCIGRPDRPGPPMEIGIVDDAGHDVAAGEPGELLVRAGGPDPALGLFSGYLKDDAATAEIWRGGWLHTGDVVRRDGDESLYFVDRKKNIIRRSGENIAAVEVETALAACEQVAQAAVISVLDPLRGEEVLAAVVLRAGAAPDRETANAIFDRCSERLAYYKLPGYVAFLERLPITSTQKIRKADLGQLAEEPLAHSHCFDLRDRKQAMRRRMP